MNVGWPPSAVLLFVFAAIRHTLPQPTDMLPTPHRKSQSGRPRAAILLPQQLGFLGVVLPVELFGEFGGGVGALGAVCEHGDADELVAGTGLPRSCSP